MASQGAVRTGAPGWEQPLALTLGIVALTARAPGRGAILLICLVGLIGVMAPVRVSGSKASPAVWLGATGLGMGAVGLVAGLGPSVALPVDLLGVTATLLAAVAEEAFFRRFLYGWLAPRGAFLAVVGAAVVFAVVHLPLYGPAALPLNLAAGLVFGWQRWVSGGWSAPAATHAMANLIGVGGLG
ncbi:MAG TPA: CPBP family intramembrane glutamic endopeptidase [Actinomycetota bacterium]|jgi:membrane protease YdiL (CAAX protease family)|nr:CPBP family intramembrane glutamic endopeptidase [Actinomycetota bacterium]